MWFLMKRSVVLKRIVVLLFLVCTYFAFMSNLPVNMATDTQYNAPYITGNGPVIDGNVTAAEWNNITPYIINFHFNNTENIAIPVELYLLHNGSALFIGLNITQEVSQKNDTDAFFIYFNQKNDGELEGTADDPNEEGIKLQRDNTTTDLCFNGSQWIPDVDVGGTEGPSNGVTNGERMWEFIFVYHSNETDFNVNLPSNVVERAKEIRFNIEYYYAYLDLYDSCTTLSNGSERLNASVWDVIVCGRVPEDPLDWGRLWMFIIVAMIVPAALILYIAFWIKNKKVY